MPDVVRIGLIEDDSVMGASLYQRLELEGFDVHWWRTGSDALFDLDTGKSPDLMICDLRLPDLTGEEVFASVSQQPDAPPFLFVTAFADINQAVRLMRAGAGDYVAKPFQMDDFLDRIGQLVRTRPVERPEDSLGPSAEMRSVASLLLRLADTSSPVLFAGETGVGKEVCARFLHLLGGSDDRPFVAVNCAAIPADLLESELFGHERGAFTGAAQRHLGYAERAGYGTLFLDEIGEMQPPLQAKLLRLIDDRSFHRVGGERPVPFHAKVLSATNRDLDEAVKDGRFRADLLYRINTVTIEVPPLRLRQEDITWLAERFLALAKADRVGGARGLSGRAAAALLGHDWPGNARELRNRIERAVALSEDGAWIEPDDLFPERLGSGDVLSSAAGAFESLVDAREAAEARQIRSALIHSKGQISEAAKLLQISRTTLWQKMRRFGIEA